jgi:hypothetical protein
MSHFTYTEISSPNERACLFESIVKDRKEALYLSTQIDIQNESNFVKQEDLRQVEKNLDAVSTLYNGLQARINENKKLLSPVSDNQRDLSAFSATDDKDFDEKENSKDLRGISGLHETEIDYTRARLEDDIQKIKEVAYKKQQLVARKDQLQSQLAQESNILASLELRHKDLITAISENQAIAAHINALPDTLLADIFEQVLEESIQRARTRLGCPHKNITLTLSHVCGRWRSLVKVIPSLWIYIPLYEPEGYKIKKWVDTIDYHLSHVHYPQKLIFRWPQGVVGWLYEFQIEPIQPYLEQRRGSQYASLLQGANTIEIIGRDLRESYHD